ncbi:hypothetical protein DINM_004790 [Dirofilaria immitis]|nr:hypothetical protein [Dirofilaria immitis]
MDITVNKTEFEDLKNATDVDMSTLSLIPYMILAVVFLNNALSGMSAISVGLKRLIISTVEEQKLRTTIASSVSVPVFLLTTFSLNGWSLLMNSVERLCVVAYPIYYYTHSKRIICSLIIAQYTITIIVVTSTILASLVEPIRYVSNFCISRCGTINTAMYLCDGSCYKIADYCDELRIFTSPEFLQYGDIISVSAKGSSACCGSWHKMDTNNEELLGILMRSIGPEEKQPN